MSQEDLPGGLLQVAEPAEEPLAVGMSRESIQLPDLGLHLPVPAVNPNEPLSVQDLAAQGPLGLVADEQDGRVGSSDVQTQVVFDTSRRAHARGGHDDARFSLGVEGFGFLDRPRHLQTGELQRLFAVVNQLPGFFVEALAVLSEDGGHIHGHRTVQKGGDAGDAPAVGQSREMIDQFLSPLDGEHRNHQIATARERFVDNCLELCFDIPVPVLHVIAVAVGRFHDHIVRAREYGGIADQRLAPLANITGEDERGFMVVVACLELDHGRTQDVSRIVQRRAQAVAHGKRFAVRHADQQRQRVVDVGFGEQRDFRMLTAPSFFVVSFLFVPHVFRLNAGRIAQNDFREVDRRSCAIDRAAESFAHQAWQQSAMVDVHVCQHDGFEFVGWDRRWCPVPVLVGTLLEHAAVHQDFALFCLQAISRSGHLLIRAQEMQLHDDWDPVFSAKRDKSVSHASVARG